MPSVCINRIDKYRGRGVSSGVWEWDELPLCDSVFGNATVHYTVECRRPVKDEGYEIGIYAPKVMECAVCDDDGVQIPLTPEDHEKLKASVLDAFKTIESYVLDFEYGLL